jgi:hypothetical protein
MGGTDDPSNLVKLTVKEHAAAHKKLWEEYGDIRDKLAWQGLLGIVSKEEIVSKLTNNAKGSKWYYNPENSNERKMIKPTQEIPEGWLPGRGNNTWTKNRDYKIDKNYKNCDKQCLACKIYSIPKKDNSRHVDVVVGVSNFIIDKHKSFGYFTV